MHIIWQTSLFLVKAKQQKSNKDMHNVYAYDMSRISQSMPKNDIQVRVPER